MVDGINVSLSLLGEISIQPATNEEINPTKEFTYWSISCRVSFLTRGRCPLKLISVRATS